MNVWEIKGIVNLFTLKALKIKLKQTEYATGQQMVYIVLNDLQRTEEVHSENLFCKPFGVSKYLSIKEILKSHKTSSNKDCICCILGIDAYHDKYSENSRNVFRKYIIIETLRTLEEGSDHGYHWGLGCFPKV